MKNAVFLTILLTACSGPDPISSTSTGDDAGMTADLPDLRAQDAPDTRPPDAASHDAGLIRDDFAAECDAIPMDGGQRTSNAACSASGPVGGNGIRTMVRADCTNPEITAHLNKRHLVLLPDAPRDALWVHLAGTGGEPANTENIGLAAMQEGYRFVGLAYPNDRNTNDRCRCPDGPRPAVCKELVRHEVVTGEDVTPWFDMEADEAIIPRLTALLAWLHADDPAAGWDAFVDASGQPVWTKIAVSGFSQGGGMTTMLGRDVELNREFHFSNIVGSLYSVLLDPASATACGSDADCAPGVTCCGVSEAPCATIPDGAICLEPAPEQWAYRGADTDGDGLGDGDLATRATPTDRIFVIVHRSEDAWSYTPGVTELMGIGGMDAYVDVDSDRGPYPAATRLFSTDLAPRGNGCSTHQAMGSDACQPRDGGNRPANLPAWRHAMNTAL